MLHGTLTVIALGLTIAMFSTRQMMLGFPCLIFWAILSGYAYQQSTATWDIYYLLFFGSIFMGVFCAIAAFALRTKKEEAREGDLYFDEGGDDDVKFVDESSSDRSEDARDSNTKDKDAVNDEDIERPSRRVRDIRERASKRRTRWE
jgi:hypothetical protein